MSEKISLRISQNRTVDQTAWPDHTVLLLVYSGGSDMKNLWFGLPLIVLMSSRSVLAQEGFKRFELQIVSGVTASGSVPLTSDDDADHGAVHVGSSYNFGATFAVNLNDLDAIEAFWQRQLTEGRLSADSLIPTPTARPPGFDLRIDQFRCNFLHHYRITDPRALPYVMAGLGVTRYFAEGNGQSDSMLHFSFALGGGMKYFFTRNFGIRGEARWSPTVVSSSGSQVFCFVGGGAACLLNLKAAIQHQLDLNGGLVFRF